MLNPTVSTALRSGAMALITTALLLSTLVLGVTEPAAAQDPVDCPDGATASPDGTTCRIEVPAQTQIVAECPAGFSFGAPEAPERCTRLEAATSMDSACLPNLGTAGNCYQEQDPVLACATGVQAGAFCVIEGAPPVAAPDGRLICPDSGFSVVDTRCVAFSGGIPDPNVGPCPGATTDPFGLCRVAVADRDSGPQCTDGNEVLEGDQCVVRIPAGSQCPVDFGLVGSACINLTPAAELPASCAAGDRGAPGGCFTYVAKGPQGSPLCFEGTLVGELCILDFGPPPCGPGLAEVGGRCLAFTSPFTPAAQCPVNSFENFSGNCLRALPDAEPPFDCASPLTQLDGANCVIATSTFETCSAGAPPVGFIFTGGECVRSTPAASGSVACDPSSIDIGGSCFMYAASTHGQLLTCLDGQLDDGRCLLPAVETPQDPVPLDCPTGYAADASGVCARTEPAVPGPACPTGALGSAGGCYFVVDNDPATGFCPTGSFEDFSGTCRMPVADVAAPFTCPDETSFLDGQVCVFTAERLFDILPPLVTCDAGTPSTDASGAPVCDLGPAPRFTACPAGTQEQPNGACFKAVPAAAETHCENQWALQISADECLVFAEAFCPTMNFATAYSLDDGLGTVCARFEPAFQTDAGAFFCQLGGVLNSRSCVFTTDYGEHCDNLTGACGAVTEITACPDDPSVIQDGDDCFMLVPPIGVPLGFVPVNPCAVFDSRVGGGPASGQSTLTAQITGAVAQSGQPCAAAGVVPANASAAMINVVAVNPTLSGNLRISATGTQARGGVVNFGPGNAGAGTNSNAVPVELSTSGQVDVFVNGPAGQAATHVRLVVLGYYVDPALDDAALGFVPVTPCAVFDSAQTGVVPIGQSTLPAQISGSVSQSGQGCAVAGVVPAGASAAMINVVAVNPTESGNLRISARGTEAKGGVVNFGPGNNGAGTNSNAVPVELSASGAVDVFINAVAGEAATRVRLIVLGYYIDPALDGDALGFVPVTPCAIFDTRVPGTPGTGQSTLTAQAAGSVAQSGQDCASTPGVIPDGAAAAMINVVAVNPTSNGNLRIAAAGIDASGGVVNFGPGNAGAGTNSNAVPVELSDGGAVDVFVNASTGQSATHVRLVVLGYYQ